MYIAYCNYFVASTDFTSDRRRRSATWASTPQPFWAPSPRGRRRAGEGLDCFGLLCFEAYKELATTWRGKRCLWLSKTAGSDYLEARAGQGRDSLPEGTEITVVDVEEADFILCSGTQVIRRASLGETW